MAHRACDSPSCRFVRDSISLRSLWRPVVPTMVRPALPSWRSENRSLYQILKSWSVLKRWIMTVRRDCDGPLCRSVTEFRESILSTQFSEFLSVLGRDTLDGPSCPWHSVVGSVVGSVVSACFSRNKICYSKWLNRSLQIWSNYLLIVGSKNKLYM